MRFKLVGIVLLLAAVGSLVYGFVAAKDPAIPAIEIQIFALAAIFLAVLVRILQAEKHHRDEMKERSAVEETDEEE